MAAKKTTRPAKKKAKQSAVKVTALSELNDSQLSKVYEEHGFNAASVARALGVKRQTVNARLKKANITNEAAKAAGKAAVAVSRVVNQANQGFQDGYNGSLKNLGLLHRLDAALDLVEEMQVSIKKEIDKQDGRFKPYQIDQMLKLIREIRGLTESSFTIKSKLHEKAAMDSFIEAVVRIMEKQVPNAQQQLYIELSRMGLEEQVAVEYKAEDVSN